MYRLILSTLIIFLFSSSSVKPILHSNYCIGTINGDNQTTFGPSISWISALYPDGSGYFVDCDIQSGENEYICSTGGINLLRVYVDEGCSRVKLYMGQNLVESKIGQGNSAVYIFSGLTTISCPGYNIIIE